MEAAQRHALSFVWKLVEVKIEGSQVFEEWSWEWVETPGMPTISQVEDMLRKFARERTAKEAAKAASKKDSAASETPSSS